MNKLYNDTAVQAIANAIRAKNGSSDTYTIAEMSTALNDLSYYAKPTISNVALATFEADGLPLNSLKVSVEAKQDLSHGAPSPTNICPISGWDAVVVSDVDDVDNPTVTQTTTISLPQTVYGGELDVVNGVLRITKILYTKTSVSYYGLYGDDNAPLFYFDITDSINGYWDITCESNNKLYSNYYNSISTINGAGMKNCEIRTQQATPPTKIYFRDDRFTDETSINTWLASNPLQVLCVLAEPIIINLTPSLIKSLNGINNLSVDCGEIIELEYFKEV